MTELHGSCLCGGIAYVITAPLKGVLNCHCSMCRKAHGAAFRTRASVKVADFRFVSGEELLTFYESSPGERRSFCEICGSVIITKFDSNPAIYGFALGTLDSDPGIEIKRHIFTKYKAPWFEITDDIPQIPDVTDEELRAAKSKK
tara:strand:- start:11785 stop:12219 length:435 start_codon:yes stop_codon:yes gene_type:complete